MQVVLTKFTEKTVQITQYVGTQYIVFVPCTAMSASLSILLHVQSFYFHISNCHGPSCQAVFFKSSS